MNRALKFIKVATCSIKANQKLLNFKNVTRNMSSVTTWNKDWQPGPYPRTKEERIAAAKKYNMIPEDYEPYPEEEGYGDYPMFKIYHLESRNPHEPFDWESTKRNYGEPMHPDFDICLEDRTNFDRKYKTPVWKQVIILASIVTAYVSIIHWDLSHPYDHKMIPKQLPFTGEIHYTFEPEE